MDNNKYESLLKYLNTNGYYVDYNLKQPFNSQINNDFIYLQSFDKIHNSFLNNIINNIGRIGINDDNLSFKEVRLADKNNYYGRTDIIVLTKNSLYLIEGKVIRSDNKDKFSKHKKSAKDQLKRFSLFFKINFDILANSIIVYKHKNQSNNFLYEKIHKSIDEILNYS
jgi:hypothetical protein